MNGVERRLLDGLKLCTFLRGSFSRKFTETLSARPPSPRPLSKGDRHVLEYLCSLHRVEIELMRSLPPPAPEPPASVPFRPGPPEELDPR